MNGSLATFGVIGTCVAVVVIVVVLLMVTSVRQERERRDGLRQWSARHGWQLVDRPDVQWGRRLPGQSRRGGVSLALFGMVGGRSVAIGEYSYTRTTSKSGGRPGTTSTTYRYVVAVVRFENPRPAVAVYRRGGLSKMWRSVFGDRSTALGYEPFDREYRVTAEDPNHVRAMLSGPLVAAHMAGQLPDWSLEGYELLTFRDGRIGDPDSIPAQIEPLLRVAAHLH